MRKHQHYGVLTTRAATWAEYETNNAWGIIDPTMLTVNICATCKERI